MKESTHLLPQAPRLLARMASLEAPVIALWSWPGSGSSAVVQAFLARPNAIGLTLADLAREESARAALDAARTARWLVVAGDPGQRVGELASWLRPGQQLVFAGSRRWSGGPAQLGLIPPQELLLTVSEVATLWHLVTGSRPTAAAAEALWAASDGWYRPLRLVLEATNGLGLDNVTAEQLLEIPPVRYLLRHEILDAVTAAERDLLLAAPVERPAAAPAGAGVMQPSGAGVMQPSGVGAMAHVGAGVVAPSGARVAAVPAGAGSATAAAGGAVPAVAAAAARGGRRRRGKSASVAADSTAGTATAAATGAAAAGAASVGAAAAAGAAAAGAATAAAAPAPGSGSGAEEDSADAGVAAWRLVDSLGLWVEGAERDRLPALLAASLERERRRRGNAADAQAPAASAADGGAGRSAGSGPAAAGPRGAGAGGSRQGRSGAAVGTAGSSGGGAGRPTYRLRLFGAPVVQRVEDGGAQEVEWTLRRSFLVLAFIASSPGLAAVRDDLEEAVWPADGERTIDRNFHPTLSHLRRSLARQRSHLPAPLLFRGGAYRLNPEIDWDIDAQEFQQRIDEGRDLLARGEARAAADAWRRAWQSYHGPFLQGQYAAWAVARREAYQERYVELLRGLGDLSVRLERAEDALDAYRAVLFEDPLQELTHLAVMRLYAGQGRRDQVRRQYERLSTLLLDELGVEPLPETVQEYHRLMS